MSSVLTPVPTTPTASRIDPATRNLALFVVCMGSCLSPLCLASVNVAIPSMAQALNADAILVSWMPTVFLLSNVALMLPFGKLADNFGRKRIYALGLAINASASFGAFLSPSIEWILFFRCIQGAGSAMSFGTGMAIITSVFPADKRGLPLGLNTASVYIGLTIAPALGGLITEILGWRAVFFLPVPLAALLITLILIYLKADWKKNTYSPFDWTGTAIFGTATLALVFGLTRLPEWQGLLILMLAFTLMGVFIWHQSRSPAPLIRVQMFRESRLLSCSLMSASLMYASTYPLSFLLSLYLQYIRGLSPLAAGQVILVQAMAMACLAPFAGKLSDRIEPRVISTAGCVSVALGFGLLTQLDSDTTNATISTALICIGIGFGLFSAPNHNSVMSAVPPQDVGLASATINLARVSGNLVGISLVNLLVHLLLGDTKITPEYYPQLLSTLHLALTVAFGFTCCAILVSAARGKRPSANQRLHLTCSR